MSRPRGPKNRGLPDYVYPVTRHGKITAYNYVRLDIPKGQPGRNKSLGQNRAEAIKAAKALNEQLRPAPDLVKRVMRSTEIGEPLSVHLEWVLAQWQHRLTLKSNRRLAPSTFKQKSGYLSKLNDALGSRPIVGITRRHLVDWLDQFPVSVRLTLISILREVFTSAVQRGRIEINPSTDLAAPVYEKERLRLSYEAFVIIRGFASPVIQHAMDLGLHTLQRVSDLIRIRKRLDPHDTQKPCYLYQRDGQTILHIEQKKTGHILEASLEWSLKGRTIREVIDICTDDVVSQFILHHPRSNMPRYQRLSGHPLTEKFASRGFAAARKRAMSETGLFVHNHWLLDKDGRTLVKNPTPGQLPSFHEIRSLGISLYKLEGKDPQPLAGHEDKKTTERYQDGHTPQAVWVPADTGKG
jgi:enterobacteria phage integrase